LSQATAKDAKRVKGLVLAAVVANVLVFLTFSYAWWLHEVTDDAYKAISQEDEAIEWGTYWAFFLAAGLFVFAAVRQRRSSHRVPWFLLGLSFFCFLVAMEEISWGQRVFGYRPPVYFLEQNFQQELNFHNVMDTGFRKLMLKAIILGYGLVLPLLAAVPPLRKLFDRWAVIAPPLALAPAFVGIFAFYEIYPWSLSGEWAELMLGLGFLFSALSAIGRFAPRVELPKFLAPPAITVAVSWLLVAALGFAQASLTRFIRVSNPETIETTRGELEALKRDFLSGKVRTKCNRHKRLYTFKEQYHQDYLVEGEFAGLVQQGLPEDRANFLLDPWNSPYWIRDRCKSNDTRRVVFIYSFGPNRKRESGRYKISGDDVGVVIYDGRPIKDITRGR